MLAWMQRLVERQILKAWAEGKLQGLAGEGKPLPDHPEAPFVDTGDAVGFRMMAEAGVLPPEIVLKKQIAAQKLVLARIADPDQRKAEMAKLSDLMLRYEIARESRKRFMR